MYLPERNVTLADGQTVVLRSARTEDSEILLEYVKAIAGESPFLVNEPEEITLTLEQEERFITAHQDNEKALLLVGFLNGEHVGNCSFHMISTKQRYRHRCSLGIALRKKFWGMGIGRRMMETVLEQAKACGYEQVELEVVTDNVAAIRLYESLGFEICGRVKHGMKYKDGSYAELYMMMKFF